MNSFEKIDLQTSIAECNFHLHDLINDKPKTEEEYTRILLCCDIILSELKSSNIKENISNEEHDSDEEYDSDEEDNSNVILDENEIYRRMADFIKTKLLFSFKLKKYHTLTQHKDRDDKLVLSQETISSLIKFQLHFPSILNQLQTASEDKAEEILIDIKKIIKQLDKIRGYINELYNLIGKSINTQNSELKQEIHQEIQNKLDLLQIRQASFMLSRDYNRIAGEKNTPERYESMLSYCDHFLNPLGSTQLEGLLIKSRLLIQLKRYSEVEQCCDNILALKFFESTNENSDVARFIKLDALGKIYQYTIKNGADAKLMQAICDKMKPECQLLENQELKAVFDTMLSRYELSLNFNQKNVNNYLFDVNQLSNKFDCANIENNYGSIALKCMNHFYHSPPDVTHEFCKYAINIYNGFSDVHKKTYAECYKKIMEYFAHANVALQKYNMAEEIYNFYLNLEPENIDFLIVKILNLFHQEKYIETMNVCKELLKLDSKHELTLVYMLTSCYYTKHYIDAKQTLENFGEYKGHYQCVVMLISTALKVKLEKISVSDISIAKEIDEFKKLSLPLLEDSSVKSLCFLTSIGEMFVETKDEIFAKAIIDKIEEIINNKNYTPTEDEQTEFDELKSGYAKLLEIKQNTKISEVLPQTLLGGNSMKRKRPNDNEGNSPKRFKPNDEEEPRESSEPS